MPATTEEQTLVAQSIAILYTNCAVPIPFPLCEFIHNGMWYQLHMQHVFGCKGSRSLMNVCCCISYMSSCCGNFTRQTLKILAEAVDLKDTVCICSILVTLTSILIYTAFFV